ncbi:MAG TPA: HD domain-containing phosphohydrolase [Kofleriaceae bacterium]|nr:HD domain-containing phosphohydrolase [Kofleriaceae bacterium]
MSSPSPTPTSSSTDANRGADRDGEASRGGDDDGDSQVSARILVVDDEKVIREILCEFLALEGYVVRGVEDGEKALTELRLRPYDIVISDLKMPKLSGLELLERITSEKLDVLTVIMTGFGTVESAIEAMKKGAYDYILKPFKVEEVVHIVQRGLDRQRLQQENIRLREALTLYKVSEAMATSLDIDHVLDVILHATVHEVQCDVATLHLADPKTGRYEERIRMCSEGSELSGEVIVPAPNPHELIPFFHSGSPILAHGVKANRFLDTIGGGPGGRQLVSYAAVPLQVSARVIGMLNVFSFTRGKQFDEGSRKMLAILASRAAASIENARLYDDLVAKNAELRVANQSLEENFQQTVAGFAQALEESDRYTRGHSERVAMYAELLAVGIGLPDSEVETVVKAGLMHDIGKIGIRYELINKPGKLSPEEVSMFREHPDKGRRILAPIPCMRHLIEGAWCHHEFFDGGGYPRGLGKDGIPILGRIVAIADAYDAMTSDRAYRRALRHETAVAEIERCSGTQFDPELAELFLARIEELRADAHRRGEPHLVPP